jgi:type II secretory pathway component GspD/PulD (secretin)
MSHFVSHGNPQDAIRSDRQREPVFSDVAVPVSDGRAVSDVAGARDGSVWLSTGRDVLYRYDRLTGWDRVRIPGWDAGTIVTVTPQIAEADHLLLDYSVSLSSFVGDSTDPALPPPRQQNRLASRVSIPDGYTVVVGGLELESDGRGVSQVPLLGRIPLIGEAFKSRSISRNRSRFFVFIRANVLRHEGFEDLRYLSELDLYATSMDRTTRDWPEVVPRVIR